MRTVRLAAALALVALVACGGDDDDGGGTAAAVADGTTTTESPSTASAPAVQAGRVVLETADGGAFTFIVFECLLGEATGSPSRRLALSASTEEPFMDADEVLNLDILVSAATGAEEHVITLTRVDPSQPSFGASDTGMPSRGGRAPDDWIHVDDATGTVYGDGFELVATDGSGESLGVGSIVADCPD